MVDVATLHHSWRGLKHSGYIKPDPTLYIRSTHILSIPVPIKRALVTVPQAGDSEMQQPQHDPF